MGTDDATKRTAGSDLVEAFIARWQGREGGQERANYALFLAELCDVLGVSRPDPAGATTEANDYVFERVVRESVGDGAYTNRRVDLYRRGAFILEAKQSRQKGGAKEVVGAASVIEQLRSELDPRAYQRLSFPTLPADLKPLEEAVETLPKDVKTALNFAEQAR